MKRTLILDYLYTLYIINSDECTPLLVGAFFYSYKKNSLLADSPFFRSYEN
jgi:hypothetical protein